MNNPAQVIAALNFENRQLKERLQVLSEQRGMQHLFDKLVCAAMTGAATQYKSPSDAASFAVQCADALISEMRKAPPEEKPELKEDHEMNQRP